MKDGGETCCQAIAREQLAQDASLNCAPQRAAGETQHEFWQRIDAMFGLYAGTTQKVLPKA